MLSSIITHYDPSTPSPGTPASVNPQPIHGPEKNIRHLADVCVFLPEAPPYIPDPDLMVDYFGVVKD